MENKIEYSINHTKIIFEKFEDETVLINLEKGNYYSLMNVSRNIWMLIEKGVDKISIISIISKMYNKPEQEIKPDINVFFETLLTEALIEPIASSAQTTRSVTEAIENIDKPYVKPLLEIYSDMQDLILLDPIHDVNESGWPNAKDKKNKK